MSGFGGSNLDDEGLIFSYDTSSSRSYKGAPTKNKNCSEGLRIVISMNFQNKD